jgi:hypothetical protein
VRRGQQVGALSPVYSMIAGGAVSDAVELVHEKVRTLQDIAAVMPQDQLVQATMELGSSTAVAVEILAEAQAGVVIKAAVAGIAVDLLMRLVFGR